MSSKESGLMPGESPHKPDLRPQKPQPPLQGTSQAKSPGRQEGPQPGSSARSPWKLYLLILVCVAPVVASYLAYYVFPPSERNNYGFLIEPQRPVPELAFRLVHAPDGSAGAPADADQATAAAAAALKRGLQAQGLAALKGKWIMLAIDSGACDLACAEKLFFMRQTHVALGRERGRLERVLLVTDDKPLPAPLLTAHPDLVVLQVKQEAIAALLPVEEASALNDHIYIIDPLHNLMMRFPTSPDPGKTRRDLQKLLKASRIG